MKNSTLIRIKVPKALYESALRKALLEVDNKEPKAGHKGTKYAKEDDYSKKAKVTKPTAKHADKEPKKGGGAHKGKAFVKDDAYTEKLKSKNSDMKLTSNSPLAEAKKKKIKEATKIEQFRTLTPNREISKDTQRMQEKKSKIKESPEVVDAVTQVLGVLAGMGAIAGGSLAITKWHDTLAKKAPKLFKKLQGASATAAAANPALNLEGKKKKSKIKETKKHDDTAEDTKLIKKLVAPSALRAAGSKHPDEKADVTLMHKKLKPSAFKGKK